MREVDPEWRVCVLICHNARDPGATRPSCGEGPGASLARALRRAVRERGLKRSVLCTRSGCLDVCSGQGTTVAIQGRGHREVWVVSGPEEVEELMDRIVGVLRV